jgi:hypothetical protein
MLIQPHINGISHHRVNTSTWLPTCTISSDDEKYYNVYKVQLAYLYWLLIT